MIPPITKWLPVITFYHHKPPGLGWYNIGHNGIARNNGGDGDHGYNTTNSKKELWYGNHNNNTSAEIESAATLQSMINRQANIDRQLEIRVVISIPVPTPWKLERHTVGRLFGSGVLFANFFHDIQSLWTGGDANKLVEGPEMLGSVRVKEVRGKSQKRISIFK